MGCCGDNAVRPSRSETPTEDYGKFEGPLRDRSCRDIIFLIIFIGALGGMGYIIVSAVQLGDAYRVVYGVDSWGNTCNCKNDAINGVSLSGRDMTGLKYSFYFNPSILSTTISGGSSGQSVVLCVNSCPGDNLTTVAELQTLHNQGTKLCRYDVAISSYSNGNSDGLGSCPPLPVEPTRNVFWRCIPETYADSINAVGAALTDLLNTIDTNFAEKCVSDVESSWKEILALCAVAFGLSLAMIIFLRFFAGVVIWIMIIALALGVVIGTIFCWYTYGTLKATVDANSNATQSEQDEVRNWLIGAIAASVVTVIILLILLVLRSRIALVVQLFKEAGKAIASMPFLLLQPIITLIVLGGTLAGLIFVFLYIETASYPYIESGTGHVGYTSDESMKGLKWLYILGIIWICEFIAASQELVIAGAVAIWFFTRDKSSLKTPIGTSIFRLIRYHLGSVAFGSLIIALLKFARLILSYIESKLKGSGGVCVTFCLKCMQCCLWCFEKILKFLNRNAYIEIAIYGYSFCKAARRAFTIIVSNALRVAAINSVGDFVLFLSKVGTVAAVACIGIELFKNRTDIYYIWVPILLSCLFAYFICGCFMDIYEMTIDTLFVCFAEDCEMNNGVSKPYYMSIGLMKFVDNSSQVIAVAEARE